MIVKNLHITPGRVSKLEIKGNKNSLINAGNNLKEFRRRYYTGFTISMIGII